MEWSCPHCNRAQIVTERNSTSHRGALDVGSRDAGLYATTWAIRCLSEPCGKLTVVNVLNKLIWDTSGAFSPGIEIKHTRLIPTSSAKPQPDFIPKPLRDDYLEACLIRDLSPKASATLARRCLQGMIRDFCDIRLRTLDAEIKELAKRVNEGKAPAGVVADTVNGIDYVRSIGNIGAHMEKDIDLIVEIEPGEAQVLIELIENLFLEWYVARETRQSRLATLKKMADSKRAELDAGRLERQAMKELPAPEAG